MILFLGSDCGPNNREMHEQIKVVARRIVRFVLLYVSIVIDMHTDHTNSIEVTRHVN